MKPIPQLPAEVAKVYDLVNWTGGHKQDFGIVFGTVDLSTLTVAKAESLVKKGFTKLVRKVANPLVKVPAEK